MPRRFGGKTPRVEEAGASSIFDVLSHCFVPLAIIFFPLLLVSQHSWGAAGTNKPAQVPKLQIGDLHALVVGVSRYGDRRIPSLQMADKDAKTFGEFLAGQKKVFKNTRVTFLLNEKATKSQVEKYLYYALHKAGKHDTIILFFSGHGTYDPMRPDDFFFMTHDCEPDYLRATAVRMSGLEFLKGIEAERVLIIA
ncbi:caspase domain-containing protein, partial [Thermodesulfobacteriota bacterium]